MSTRLLAGITAGTLALGLAMTAQATLYTYSWNSGFDAGSGVIPDGDTTGWSDTRTLSGMAAEITDVNVTLNISGGYNGDLYGYLTHSSGFAVLLNRVGKTSSDDFGYGNTGVVITLDGQASTYDKDIHLYQSATPAPTLNGNDQLTGTWLEDGRNVDPATVVDTDSRTALLSSFNTLDPNGTWTLFFADLSGGDTSTMVSWGLQIEAVPEPITWALGIFGVMAASIGVVRHWRAKERLPTG